MKPEEAASSVQNAIGTIGAAFMIDGPTFAKGSELGFPGMSFYMGGRGGALGNVPADVVVASFAFFSPETVTASWEEVLKAGDPTVAAQGFADCCAQWGRDHFTNPADLPRLIELAEKIIDAVDPSGLPLFAGWRAMPRVEDTPGRAAQVLNVLREHRGSVHACAVISANMTPLEAILTSSEAAMAPMHGWPAPHPEITEEHKAARAHAEEATNNRIARDFAVLSEAELDEFSSLVLATFKGAFG